jgi:hypothetical protein
MGFSTQKWRTMLSLALFSAFTFLIAINVGRATTFTCIQDVKTGISTCEFPKDIEDSLNKISDTTTVISNTATEIASKTPTDVSKTTDEILKKTASIENICEKSYGLMSKETSKPTMTIHGTEYVAGQTGKAWLQLLDGNNNYVDNASCFVSIYTPANTPYISRATMKFLVDGIYYYDLTIPQEIGVYPAIGLCYYVTTANVSVASGGAVTIGTVADNTYTATQVLDGTYWKIDTVKVGATYHQQEFYLNFSGVTSPTLLTDVSFDWYGKWNSALSNLQIWGWNFTSSKWVLLPNNIPNTGGSLVHVSNDIPTTNATASGILSGGKMWMKINTTTGETAKKQSQTDYVTISMIYQTNATVTTIKGSSELHVSSPTNLAYEMDTNCANVFGLEGISLEGIGECAIFRNDTIYGLPEGMMTDNITIRALETRTIYWTYQTPPSTSCLAIYVLNQTLSNGTIVPIDMSTVFMSSTDGACILSVPLDMTLGTTYSYRIYMDNFQRYKVMQYKAMADTIKSTYSLICDPYAQAQGYNYTVPILATTVISNDTVLRQCHYSHDLTYWFDLFYGQSTSINISGNYESYYSELDWVTVGLRENFQFILGFILNNTNNVATYLNATSVASFQNINYNFTSVLGNQQTMYNYQQSSNQSLSNQISNVPNNVWNYPTRNLTYYPPVNLTGMNITADVNYTYFNEKFSLMNSTMTTYYNSLHSLLISVNNTVNAIYEWFEFKAVIS